MKSNRTTKKHYEAFVKECKFWLRKLGIDYNVEFTHYPDKDGLSSSTANYKHRAATLNLSATWDDVTPLTIREIKKCALHEVLHITIDDISILALNRFLNERELDVAVESTVNRLMKFVY